LGPALLLGLLFLRYIDFPTFLIANVVVDIEPFLVLALGLNYPLHGFLHTFVGGTIVALILGLTMEGFREPLSQLLSLFKLEQDFSFKSVLLASIIGVYLHILLDSFLYIDIQPFYPAGINPLYVGTAAAEILVYSFCAWCFLGAAVVCIGRLLLLSKQSARVGV
jgi:membrane-bound metal-dependent hydrolase YbcI (DUF457 family)